MTLDDGECLDDWFVRAVLPHEGALRRYLARTRAGDDDEIEDLCQEALTRLYVAAEQERPRHAKSFLFTIARRLVIDQVRRAQIVQIDRVADLDSLSVPVDEVDAERHLSAREELALLQRALGALPPRCRAVMEMRRIQGLTQRQTARRLGISESAVEAHIQRGVRGLEVMLRDVCDVAARRDRRRRKAARERKK